MVRTLCFHCEVYSSLFLVGEVRPHKPCSKAKQTKTNRQTKRSPVAEDLSHKAKFAALPQDLPEPFRWISLSRVLVSWFHVNVGFIVQGQYSREWESSRDLRNRRFYPPWQKGIRWKQQGQAGSVVCSGAYILWVAEFSQFNYWPGECLGDARSTCLCLKKCLYERM